MLVIKFIKKFKQTMVFNNVLIKIGYFKTKKF